MISLLIALIAALVGAFAGLIAIVGVTSLDNDRGVAAFALVVAVLGFYAAALFARAAIRVRRAADSIDASARRFTYEYAVVASISAFTMMWLRTGSVGLGIFFVITILAVVALAAARDFEPPR